ncbi:hypothetical protein K493DRAFT_304060 [Basidiobolus meristosporus CBS 931.73]|uniref:Uncharacterized protein n=1 Tax=Basidiobolus meristosporus CBS 931.73 TaxID=1314790 RepID=A0A1Y1Y0A1_9FUNG|nr:hypothetical protein K493DRAFT_304060 [Basidiobolus meristosporus CBS 931.73]|eukprot:ORX91443.1 hypothetical protein K493DRAFT_304060 [Basidiobolus meristosporus CBS 931.73]
MAMVEPAPRRSEFNPYFRQSNDVDYDITSPLDSQRPYPCQGAPSSRPIATYQAGRTIPVRVGGDAPHDGGHCQFALSYDGGRTFVVIQTVLDTCLLNRNQFSVPLPVDTPSGTRVIFAWTWINKTGDRQYYMNCADININGKKSGGKITGPRLLVANYGNYPTIPEWPDPEWQGRKHFQARQTITVHGPVTENEGEDSDEDD